MALFQSLLLERSAQLAMARLDNEANIRNGCTLVKLTGNIMASINIKLLIWVSFI